MSNTETDRGAAAEQVVHTLWAGRPPCGFTKATPNHWPPGHYTVHYWEVDNMTCPGCKAWAEGKASEGGDR
jgi:hypothetical protein